MYNDLFITKLPKALNNKDNLDYFKGNSSLTKEDIIVGNMRLVATIIAKFNVSEEDKKRFISNRFNRTYESCR